jgi:sugar lactone lactonase YvrE
MTSLRTLIATFVAALALATAQAQTVFVNDFYNNTILRVDSQTGAPVLPPVSSVFLPASLTYGPDGNLYAASQATASIVRINPATGVLVGAPITFGGQITVPGGAVFAPNGDIIVADFVSQTTPGTGTVKRFTVNQTTGVASLATVLASGLNQPSGLLLNGNNLYFTETNTSTFTGGRLSVVNEFGGTVTPLVTGTPGSGFGGMALGGNTLYYSDLIGGAINRYDVGTNTALPALVGLGGSLTNQFPNGLYIDSPTSILVADLGPTNPPTASGNLRRYSTLLTDSQIGPNIVSNIFAGAVINAVPEPGTFALAGLAAVGFAAWRRKRA